MDTPHLFVHLLTDTWAAFASRLSRVMLLLTWAYECLQGRMLPVLSGVSWGRV